MATCPTCRTHYPDDVSTCAQDGHGLVPDHAVPALESELAAGTLVGEYRVEGKLGEGGFGTVYRAVHPVIGKAAAIKVLARQFSSNPQIVSRFVAEARAVNQIRHRNIIDIFSFGVLDDGRQYYVMELLEGLTLDAFVRERGRISPGEAIPILAKIARALDAAHAAGIAHRDLKPENVFLVYDEDAGLFPKLLDFGIAKLLGDSSGAQHKTRTGLAMGTPLYMSPEQCRGKNVDHRTDIYSFGIMTHELMTGCLPFDAEDAVDLLIKQTTATPPSMSSVCPDIPAALDAPVLRMLEKDPDKRPRTVGEAVEAMAKAARASGVEVKTVVTRAGQVLTAAAPVRIVTGAGGGTDVMGATQVVEAATNTQPSASVSGAGSVKENAASKKLVLLLVAVVVLGVAGAAFALRGAGEGASGAPGRGGSGAVAEASSARVEPGASAPVPVVAPMASAAPSVVPMDFAIEIKTKTKGVVAYLEDKPIGDVPGPIRLPRGKTSAVTFKAKGFVDATREIQDGAPGPLEVDLKPAQKNVSKDLEKPVW